MGWRCLARGSGAVTGQGNCNPKTAELKAEQRPKGDRGAEDAAVEGDGKRQSCRHTLQKIGSVRRQKTQLENSVLNILINLLRLKKYFKIVIICIENKT